MALPALLKAYSAEILRSDGGRTKVFIDGLRRRVERYGPKGLEKITISRPDLGVMWSVTPATSQCVEMKLPVGDAAPVVNPDELLEWEQDGTEVVDGVQYTRFRGQHAEPDAGLAHEICLIDLRTGMKRRTTTFDKNGKQALTLDWKAVTLGAPEPTVFELPANLKKVRL